MERYSIRDLGQLTGIKPHTIRIWEKRYRLLSPQRTSTNIRFYTNEDLRKLLNVSLLISNGVKISKVSSHTKDILHHKVMVYADAKLVGKKAKEFCHLLMVAALEFNEAKFEAAWKSSVKQFGVYQTMKDIIYPLLSRVGLMWSTEKISPAQEHFLSCLIRKKLLSAIDQLVQAKRKGDQWLLFLHHGEDHEIPLLLAYYLLRANGFEVIYLGTKVPAESAERVAASVKPVKVLTFFTVRQSPANMKSLLKQYSKAFSDSTLMVGGNLENFKGITLPRNLRLLESLQDFEQEVAAVKKPVQKKIKRGHGR